MLKDEYNLEEKMSEIFNENHKTKEKDMNLIGELVPKYLKENYEKYLKNKQK